MVRTSNGDLGRLLQDGEPVLEMDSVTSESMSDIHHLTREHVRIRIPVLSYVVFPCFLDLTVPLSNVYV